MRRTGWNRLLVLAAVLAVAGVAGPSRAGAEPEELIQALEEIPEHRLLDVGILVLDPGIDEEKEVEELEKRGVFPYLRRSEARCIPFAFKNTLERSGYWGAVRLIPGQTASVDLVISGEIAHSTGKDMALIIQARDSTGRVWLKNKKYKADADPRAYADDEGDEIDAEVVKVDDPFESFYIRLANDLQTKLRKLDDDDIATIRTVSELKFAEDLAPYAFSDYLRVKRNGKVKVAKLPARDDPMLNRVGRIREVDYEFIDTLNEFYAGFCTQMDSSYDQWREYSYEEQVELQRLRRKARMQAIIGGLLLLGGIVAETDAGSSAARAAGQVAQVAGGAMVVGGVLKGKDIKTHKETLRELAGSLDAEVEPMLTEVEGRTLRLSGSAETQYAEFRELLREVFAAETGLDPDSESADTADPEP